MRKHGDLQHVPTALRLGKVIPKRLMDETPKLKELVQTEIAVLQRCFNDNVIKYIDSFGNDRNVYIFTEYCNGGDMEEYLKSKKTLGEDEAVEFLKQILNGFRVHCWLM
jgi:serine/threonine-protein kinase ULK/ATG1